MIFTLALRNLLHDRVRLAVTLVGILFSIVLVAVQLGLYLGSSRMITANIARSNADLFVTAFGAKSFEDGGLLLTDRERHQAVFHAHRRISRLHIHAAQELLPAADVG